MADYQRYFGVQFTDLTPAEQAWWAQVGRTRIRRDGVWETCRDLVEQDDDYDAAEADDLAAFGLEDYDPEESGGRQFLTCEVELDGDRVALYSEGQNETEFYQVAHLLQRFLKEFRPQATVDLICAVVPCPLRLDEVTGGAFHITASQIRERWLGRVAEDLTQDLRPTPPALLRACLQFAQAHTEGPAATPDREDLVRRLRAQLEER